MKIFLYKINEVQLASFTNPLHVNYADHTMHTTKLLLNTHHLPKPSNVTMKCQDIAKT